jgi:hypothetical protein
LTKSQAEVKETDFYLKTPQQSSSIAPIALWSVKSQRCHC